MDSFQSADRTLIWYGTYAARTVYAQHWRENKVPDLEEWVIKLSETMGMESLTKYLRDRNKQEYKLDWEKNQDLFN